MAQGLIAGMSEADFALYLNKGFVETNAQITETFNAATRNSFMLVDGDTQGDGTKESFMAVPGYNGGSTVKQRDLTSSSDKVWNAANFQQEASLVYAGEIANPGDSASALKRIKKLDTYAENLGAQIAKDMLVEKQNIAVSAIYGSLQEASANFVNAATDITFDEIVDTATTVGDQSGNLSTLMMDMRTFAKYAKNRVAANIFQESGITVYGGTPGTWGYDVLVYDNAYFAKSAIVADKGLCLLVGPGALVLKHDTTVAIEASLDRKVDNIPLVTTGEYTVECMVRGMKYGGADNPSFATMQAGASWTRTRLAKNLPYTGLELTIA